MRKLLLCFLGAFVGLELLGMVLASLQAPPQRFKPASLENIDERMTLEEVALLLGPPGDYSGSARKLWPERLELGRASVRRTAEQLGWSCHEWVDGRGAIVVLFDEKGLVVWKFYQSVQDTAKIELERIRRKNS